LKQTVPVDTGKHHETLRRHTLKVSEASRDCVAIRPETAASAIVVTLDSTFIRSCAEGERRLEIRVGNVETGFGGRWVFGAVAKAGTDIEMSNRRTLDAVGRTKDRTLTAFTDGCPALRRALADRLETRNGLVHFIFMIPALWPTTNRTRIGILCGRVQNGTMNKMADSSRTAVGCPASRRRHTRRGAKYALSPSSSTARV